MKARLFTLYRDMKRILQYFPIFFLIFGLVSGCTSESPDPAPSPSSPEAKRTLLIYAVATNSLSTALSGDMAEMRKAAPSVEGLGKDVNVILYRLDYTAGPALYELDAASSDFVKIKDYDRGQFSTDPKRIAQVIADVKKLRPAEKYGLVMWSHATGWSPDFSTHSSEVKRSFGQDKYGGISDSTDLDELASVIPSDTFDFIWWDCCYMGSIEVAYQMRGKCDFMAAAPSEVPGNGMPYHITLPMLASASPRIAEAAAEYFNFYKLQSEGLSLRDRTPSSIAVYDMREIEGVAEAAAHIYKEGEMPDESVLQNYARRPNGPFYDFGQYTRLYTQGMAGGDAALLAFNAAMGRFVIAGYCTPYNFNCWTATSYTDPSWYTWDTDIYSGVTCHYPDPSTVAEEEYYRSLDWWQRVGAR